MSEGVSERVSEGVSEGVGVALTGGLARVAAAEPAGGADCRRAAPRARRDALRAARAARGRLARADVDQQVCASVCGGGWGSRCWRSTPILFADEALTDEHVPLTAVRTHHSSTAG